jgi:hypothetical protein
MNIDVFTFAFTERNLKRWKLIQVVSILPLAVSTFLMFYFRASAMGIFIFLLALIVGVVLPQLCINQIASHLILQKGMDEIQNKLDKFDVLLDSSSMYSREAK